MKNINFLIHSFIYSICISPLSLLGIERQRLLKKFTELADFVKLMKYEELIYIHILYYMYEYIYFFCIQGAMQDLNNLRQEVYLGGGISHQRISGSPQMRQHQHSQHLSTSPTRPHYHHTLLSPPAEALSRSISDSSLHQNLVQGKTVNNRKGALAFIAFYCIFLNSEVIFVAKYSPVRYMLKF